MFLECEPGRVRSMLLYFSETAKGRCASKDTFFPWSYVMLKYQQKAGDCEDKWHMFI